MLPGMTAAVEIAREVRAGARSAAEVVEQSLARARAAADLNMLISLDEEGARAAAARVDERVAAGEDPGPLAGVPLVVKDNILTAGLLTTAASASLARFVPPVDATVVERLRSAGAVVIGKSNLDEFGMGSSTENSAYGPTRNPWDLDRVPGGSSGGSAAAVAAGVVPLALGTDTGGSVRQPAAFCGVLGFKPTYGSLSRYGVIAFASSLDQVGVMARSSADMALALELMAGADPRDSTCLPEAPAFDSAAAGADDLAGLRVGLVRELSGEGNGPEVREGLAGTVAALEALGATVAEVELPHARHGVATYYLVATAEASSNLSRYDGTIYSARHGDNGLGQARSMMESRGRWLGREVRRRVLMGTYALSAGYYDAYYGRALKVRRLIADDFERAFRSVDVLLTPTTPEAAFPLGSRRDDPLAMYLGDVDTCLANLAGLPAVSVPAPRPSGGLPCGAQFLAPPMADGRLLRVAAALELHGGEAFAPAAR
jgi:aspartyl-tRNA(Asn)/glutamyl-tRNA(Gln) amidotransferase subunit A